MSIFTLRSNSSVIVNQPGTFYIGDPCYCFSHSTSTWDNLLSSNKFDDEDHPIATSGKIEILGFATAGGDGTYQGYIDDKPYKFPVDSGTLGIVPLEFIETGSTFDKDKSCGQLIKLVKGDVIFGTDGDLTVYGSCMAEIETADHDYDTDGYDFDDMEDEG